MSEIVWDGAVNLSDLGGRPTAGGETKRGSVFRSGRSETITNHGWRHASRAGLRTIVDLRNESERARRDYDPVIDAHAMFGITVVSAPTEDPDDPEFMRVCGPWLDHPRSYAENVRLFPARFRSVFETVARSEGAVLIHCSGGRDRTGMVVAMLLALVGVPAEAIADDYEVAFRAAHAHQALHPERVRDELYSEDDLTTRVQERRAALIAWIEGFDVGHYLVKAGVSAHDLARLHDRLCTSAVGDPALPRSRG